MPWRPVAHPLFRSFLRGLLIGAGAVLVVSALTFAENLPARFIAVLIAFIVTAPALAVVVWRMAQATRSTERLREHLKAVRPRVLGEIWRLDRRLESERAARELASADLRRELRHALMRGAHDFHDAESALHPSQPAPWGIVITLLGAFLIVPILMMLWLDPRETRRLVQTTIIVVSAAFGLPYYFRNQHEYPRAADKITFFCGLLLPSAITEIVMSLTS